MITTLKESFVKTTKEQQVKLSFGMISAAKPFGENPRCIFVPSDTAKNKKEDKKLVLQKVCIFDTCKKLIINLAEIYGE